MQKAFHKLDEWVTKTTESFPVFIPVLSARLVYFVNLLLIERRNACDPHHPAKFTAH
jgi:hypothetical protein